MKRNMTINIAIAFVFHIIAVVATVYETFEALPATEFHFVIVGGKLFSQKPLMC